MTYDFKLEKCRVLKIWFWTQGAWFEFWDAWSEVTEEWGDLDKCRVQEAGFRGWEDWFWVWGLIMILSQLQVVRSSDQAYEQRAVMQNPPI